MALVDDVRSALPDLRDEAEAMMASECIASRPGEPFTDDDGIVTTPLIQVYAGACKVQTTQAQAASPVAGGHAFTVENLQIHFPVRASLKTGDSVQITIAVDFETGLPDLDIQGNVYRLVELARGTWRTADRWNVELVTA